MQRIKGSLQRRRLSQFSRALRKCRIQRELERRRERESLQGKHLSASAATELHPHNSLCAAALFKEREKDLQKTELKWEKWESGIQ